MKALLFDLGCVLIHYDREACIAGLASFCAANRETVEALLDEVQRDLSLGAIDGADVFALFRQKSAAPDDFDSFVAAYAAGLSRDENALAYALELEARSDLLVGAISNTNELHVYWLDKQIPELRAFDLVLMSNEIGMKKPDAAVFRLALELLDVPAAATLFVDDQEPYVEAARALGLAGVVHCDWQETRRRIEEWLRA